MAFTEIAELEDVAAVYEEGWQSWSPAGRYAPDARSPRPHRPLWQTMAFRPERPAPPEGFQGEGLLAVEFEDGTARLWVAPAPDSAVPSIRVAMRGGRLVLSADGPVDARDAPGGLAAGLTAWGDHLAATLPIPERRALGPGWCSWYCHWGAVTEGDVVAAMETIDRLELPVAVLQVDDGHQREIGDWLERSDRFGPLRDLAARIRAAGREPGLWTAPFMVGARSRIAVEHPDWLVGDALASPQHWDQPIHILDVTHPEAAEHLAGVYRRLAEDGFTYHKIDFLYAGAQVGRRHGDADPVAAYRHGLRLIRDALGPDATVLGCGAPLLPSLGLVDAMRVSPDVDPDWRPPEDDVSQPGMLSAVRNGQARAWQHGRLWINDPDCLLARPQVPRRETWGRHLADTGGLAVSSDRLGDLDARGLELTRALLKPADPAPHGDEHVASTLLRFHSWA